MSAGFVDQWISDGLLYNIQGYVDNSSITPEEYYTGVFDVTRDKNTGDMHAFPFAFVETVLFYNKDAFDAAGVPYPEASWTWEQFLEAAQALTVDEGDDGMIDQYGFWFYGRYAHIESWIYQNDGSLLSENKTRFAPDANALEALAFLDSLIHEHGVAPEPKEMEGVRQQDVFPLGMAAMWVDGAWNINGNRETIGDSFNWGIAPLPRGPQAETDKAYGWPDSVAVGANCAYPDQAWDFIEFMTGPERTIDLTFGGKIPVYKPVALSEEFLEADQQPDNKGFLLEWADYTGPTSFTPGWGEWRGYTDGAGLEGQLGDVFNGVTDLETAIANITGHANDVLERFYPSDEEAAVEEPAAEEPAEEITMRYFMWDPSFEEKEQQMVDKFTAANPNITIDFEVVAPPDYWTKLGALSAADDLPCVFNMSAGFVDQWISDGLLYNIQSYVDNSDITPEEYYTGVFDVTRDKNTGDMHAFPFAFVETVLFYNKDAFDAAGVPYPEAGWTWEQFLAAAQALTIDEGDDGMIDQYGFWFYGRYAHIESWIYQNDGSLLSENKTRFAPDANALEALAFLDSLIHEHGVAPEPKEMEGVRQQDVFPLGMAAMWVDGAWNINGNRETIGDSFNWGIAPLPRGPQAETDKAYGWPDSVAVGANCAYPDQAWDFIEFMTGPERTIDLTFGGKIPVYKPVALSEEFLEADQQPDNKGFLLEWADYTGPTSFTPGWGEWRGYTDGAGLEGQLGDVFNGVTDLETAIASITAHANEVLERFYP